MQSFKISSALYVENLLEQINQYINDNNKKSPSDYSIITKLPNLAMQYLYELLRDKNISQDQYNYFEELINQAQKKVMEKTMLEKNNDDSCLVDEKSISLENNSSYHFAYLTSDEIFDKYIAQKNIEDALLFFSKICDVNEVSNFNKQYAIKLLHFILASYNCISQNNMNNTKITFSDLRSQLIFSNSAENFYYYIYNKQHNNCIDNVAIDASYDYFYDYLGINEVHLDSNNNLIKISEMPELTHFIDNHEIITQVILSSFTLNEEVKNLILEENNHSINYSHSNKVINLIDTIMFDSKISEEKKSKITLFLSSCSHNLEVLKNQQSISHNIIQALIYKNHNQFFEAIKRYIDYYLLVEDINENSDNLSDSSKLVLFFSDYYYQNFYFDLKENTSLFDILLSYFDKTMFNLFINKYSIPVNLAIKTVSNNEQHVFSLIEYCLYYNNINAAQELVKANYVIEKFKTKYIKNDIVEAYHYTPFTNLSSLSDSSICFLIENNLVNANVNITYNEIFEDNNQKINRMVTLPIFYFLLHYNYKNAFILLNRKTQQNLLSYNSQLNLLSYYLACVKNFDSYDTSILDLFIKEKFTYDFSNIKEFKKVINRYDLNTATEIIFYLQDIFDEELKIDKQLNEKSLLTPNKQNLVQWFDKAKLESHFKKIEKEKDSANKEFIKSMLSNNSYLKPNLMIKDEQFFTTLINEFPNFEEVVHYYKSQFRLKNLSGKTRINPILLLGEPGIGKTYFAQKLAQYLNTGYTFIDMASVTANWILTGNNSSWKSAKQGKVLESMINSNTINPVFLMDEIEKAKTGEHDPTLSLYQLLEEVNAKSFTDEFIDFSFDASGIIYIACANTLGNLSEPLQNRFKIFNIDKPNSDQLDNIIKNIYTQAVKDAKIFSLILDPIIINSLKQYSLRSIKLTIDEAIALSLLEISLDDIEKMKNSDQKIVLNLNHFKFLNKKRSMGF